MRNHLFRFYTLIWCIMMVPLLFLSGCVNEPKPARLQVEHQPAADTLMKYNKQVVKDENQMIEDYIARHQWKMERTSTGLRYHIYRSGKGQKATSGKIVTIRYSVSLLDGEEIYSSAGGDPRKFVIGQGKAESGIEEGILMLRRGDRAKFIVPSHLAFGLLGDLDKIPLRATLVYEIELLDISEP